MEILSAISKCEPVLIGNESKPFKIMAEDNNFYFCKTIHRTYKANKIFTDLLCNLFMKVLHYNTPDMKLINISRSHLQNTFYYNEFLANSTLFIGSKQVQNSSELLFAETLQLSKKKYLNYNVRDIVEITYFDFIFYNIDRHTDNFNLLKDTNRFYAIDNAQCFNNGDGIYDINSDYLSMNCYITSSIEISQILRYCPNLLEIFEIVKKEFYEKKELLLFEYQRAKDLFVANFGHEEILGWYDNRIESQFLSDDWIKLNNSIIENEFKRLNNRK